jgi:hypothetical protein
MRRSLAALAVLPCLLAGCSDDGPDLSDPKVQASAPIPGVTLPPGGLHDLVPTPEEVPAGMVPVLQGSGPRTIDVVAGYSGTGAAATQALAALRAHGFADAYVAQYANQATGQVLSVVVSRFATSTGATADFSDDQKGTSGKIVPSEQIGDASSVTTQTVTGSVSSELVLVRFVRGTDTWVIAYQAAPKADPAVPVGLAKTILARTAS